MAKTKFSDPVRKAVLAMAEAGYTDQQMADEIGVNVSTLKLWKSKHPDFLEALKAKKSVADKLVEIALFQKATGYTYETEKVAITKDGEVIREKVTERCPPDTTAAIFWLKNRRPDQWRDVQQREHLVKVTLPTIEEARAILEADYAMLPAPDVVVEDLDE